MGGVWRGVWRGGSITAERATATTEARVTRKVATTGVTRKVATTEARVTRIGKHGRETLLQAEGCNPDDVGLKPR